MIVQNETCPWNVPVRVEDGRFVPLSPAHAQFNVRVAPGAAYGGRHDRVPEHSLLFADVQTSLSCHVAGRLGSGRSGFFRGHYLKGVGRTPLAANWHRADQLHSSGHLSASSAIREYIVSRHLAAQGCAGSIVACEGVLLAELDPELAGHMETLYPDRAPDQVPPVDLHLQAITVKSGGFARASNFAWLLHHLTPAHIDQGGCSLGAFCELLTAALAAPDDPALPPAELTAASLVAQLARRVREAWGHFRQWFANGIWWGSFTNNFTLDGRFLDLETPALLLGPCFGCLSTADSDALGRHSPRSSIIGSELFTFIAHTRAFCVELHRVLGGLSRWFSPVERDFGAELAHEIAEQVLSPDQPLGSRAQALAWVQATVDEAFGGLGPDDRAAVAGLVESLYERELGDALAQDASRTAEMDLVAVPGSAWLLVEPRLRARPFGLRLGSGRLLGPSEDQCRASRAVAEIVSELDHTTRLPHLLDKLANLARQASLV